MLHAPFHLVWKSTSEFSLNSTVCYVNSAIDIVVSSLDCVLMSSAVRAFMESCGLAFSGGDSSDDMDAAAAASYLKVQLEARMQRE